MDTLKKDFQHSGRLLLIAIFFAMWPSFVQKARVISFQKSLTIQTSKAEPPRLAFDEIHVDEKKFWSEWDFLKTKDGTHLSVGDEWMKFSGRTSLHSRKVVLKPMTFTRADLEQEQAKKEWVASLPSSDQQRMQAAQEKYGTMDEDWSLPTFKELAARKIAEVRKGLQEKEQKQKPTVIVQSQQPDGTVLTPQSLHTADVEVRKDSNGYVLSGMLEIKGLPSGDPQWQIQVARYEDDVKKEDARVNLKNSTYQISVPTLSGTLLAQMVDTKTGAVLGEGSLRVSQYSTDQQRGKAKITIEKSTHEVAARFGSFYREPTFIAGAQAVREKPIATRVLFASLNTEGKTDETGTFHFDQVQKGSWGLIRTEAKGYQSGMYLVQSGHEKRLPLFPESMVKALKQIIKDQARSSEVAETGSIVWGQVLQNGKPLAGVEVDAEGLENYRPIYFNSLLLPDSQMKSTSENGYFAFIHLPAGFQSLVAHYGPSYLSHSNVVVDDETVSIAEMDSTLQMEKVDLKVFDSFTGKPSNAELEMQSLPNALTVKGYGEVQMSPVSRMSFMKVHPENDEYTESLQIYDDASDSIHIPLVRKDWLRNLLAVRRLNVSPDSGILVGFVSSNHYQVYLGHEENFPKDQIVYFDPMGNPVPSGVAGGGFVIFGAPTGVQSVVIANTQNDLLQTQVVPVDPSGVVVLKFR